MRPRVSVRLSCERIPVRKPGQNLVGLGVGIVDPVCNFIQRSVTSSAVAGYRIKNTNANTRTDDHKNAPQSTNCTPDLPCLAADPNELHPVCRRIRIIPRCRRISSRPRTPVSNDCTSRSLSINSLQLGSASLWPDYAVFSRMH